LYTLGSVITLVGFRLE